MTRRLLLAALFLALATPAFAQRPLDGWGPSWVGSKPPGGFDRPKELKKPGTAIKLGGEESGDSLTTSVWGDLPVTKGHQYFLNYQLRVHTKKGEAGPLIDVDGKAGGTPFEVAKGTAGDDWYGLEGRADIGRKKLSGAAGWPEVKAGESATVFVRVEPQLYDGTDRKYVTPARTQAVILVAVVGEGRKVASIHTLQHWIEATGKSDAAKVAEVLDGLDEYNPVECGVADAMVKTLTDKDVKKEVKLKLVAAVPAEGVGFKTSYEFCRLMEEWAKGDDAELKAAAKKALGER